MKNIRLWILFNNSRVAYFPGEEVSEKFASSLLTHFILFYHALLSIVFTIHKLCDLESASNQLSMQARFFFHFVASASFNTMYVCNTIAVFVHNWSSLQCPLVFAGPISSWKAFADLASVKASEANASSWRIYVLLNFHFMPFPCSASVHSEWFYAALAANIYKEPGGKN